MTRIVTVLIDGRSAFAEDGCEDLRRFSTVPGFAVATLWFTRRNPAASDPTLASAQIVPAPGESRLLLITFPPDTVMAASGFDPAAAGAEYLEKLPGLAETFEPDHPGMHRTPTIDYAILLEGELWLELDDGEQRRLGVGDVVVQRATRHAWRNRGAAEACMAVVMLGAVDGE